MPLVEPTQFQYCSRGDTQKLEKTNTPVIKLNWIELEMIWLNHDSVIVTVFNIWIGAQQTKNSTIITNNILITFFLASILLSIYVDRIAWRQNVYVVTSDNGCVSSLIPFSISDMIVSWFVRQLFVLFDEVVVRWHWNDVGGDCFFLLLPFGRTWTKLFSSHNLTASAFCFFGFLLFK